MLEAEMSSPALTGRDNMRRVFSLPLFVSIRSIVCLVLAALPAPAAASAATYYVNNVAGSDCNDGATENTAVATIARAVSLCKTSDRIVLAGFSQGGAVCLHTALRFSEPLAGVLALSAYLPLADSLAKEVRAEPDRLVIRMDHGDRDPVVPFALAERSRDLIEAQGFQVEFNRYSMEHGLCLPQMESLRNWFVKRLG